MRFLLLLLSCQALLQAQLAPVTNRYEFRAEHDRDGIGKFYMGREIAHVMGHQAADWLERPERETEEKPATVVEALQLKPGQAVADIGAGTGYFTWRMAEKVSPTGAVYAVEIQQEMIDLLQLNMKKRGLTNVISVLGTETDPKLPAAKIDLALMVDVYHELSYPYEVMEAIGRAIKPGGRMVFVEYRKEDPTVPIKELHKISVAQIRKEMAALPFEWVETLNVLPQQHIIIFRKK